MSNENEQHSDPNTTAQEAEPTATPVEQLGNEDDARENELPDWAKDKLSKVKREAQSLRERLRGREEEIVSLELAGVPENLRKLVPEGSPPQRLDWVRRAKAEGLLKGGAAPRPPTIASTSPSAAATVSHQQTEKLTPRELQELGHPGTTQKRRAELIQKLRASQGGGR